MAERVSTPMSTYPVKQLNKNQSALVQITEYLNIFI